MKVRIVYLREAVVVKTASRRYSHWNYLARSEGK